MNILNYIKPTQADIKQGKARQAEILKSLPIAGNKSLLQKMSKDRKDGVGGKRASNESVLTRLTRIANRADIICAAHNIVAVKEFFKNAMEGLQSEDNKSRIADMVAATRLEGADGKAAKAALGKMIAANVGHLIRATSMWIQWYESVTLGETDKPYIRNYVPQQVDVKVGTGDGYLTTHDAQPDLESDAAVPLFFILSDMVRAKLFDEYEGRIADSALAVVDISMDLAEKIDALVQLPFLVGTPNSVYTATFTNDGTAASHYHASSRINTANFPTGNIIAPSTNSGSTLPRFDCIRAIDEYFGRFGSGFDVGGDMVAGRIHVASGLAHHFGAEFSATSHQNAYTDALFKNRKMLTFNGRNYEVVPDPTIDPTAKFIYVNSNLPAGIFFEKPAGSLVHREEDEINNEVQTFERALIGYAFPVTYAPRVLAVRFQS